MVCEYVAPMFGFPLPGLGRSSAADWRTAEGGHIAERCQAFVIIALGESVLVTGGTLSVIRALGARHRSSRFWCASPAAWPCGGSTSTPAVVMAASAIAHAKSPARWRRTSTTCTLILIAGVIVSAAADDLVILHPPERIDWPSAWLLLGGPAIYVAGNGFYKRVVYGWFPLSHWAGLALLALVAPFAFHTDLLMTGGLTTAVMIWSPPGRASRDVARREPKKSRSVPE